MHRGEASSIIKYYAVTLPDPSTVDKDSTTSSASNAVVVRNEHMASDESLSEAVTMVGISKYAAVDYRE